MGAPVADGYVFVPAPDTLQLEAHYIREGQDCVNVYHVHNFNPVDNLAAFAAAALAAYVSWENTTAKAQRTPNTTFTGVYARDLGQESGAVWFQTASVLGTYSGGSALPNNCTIALKWTTGRGGRSYRGRSFWIGLGGSMLSTTHLLSAASQTALLAAGSALITALKDLSFTGSGTGLTGTQMVIVSRQNAKHWRDAAVTTPVTGCAFADLVVDSQRRRLPGRGK